MACAAASKSPKHFPRALYSTSGVHVVTAEVGLSSRPTVFRALGIVDSLGKTTLTAPMTGKVEGPFDTTGQVRDGAVVARNVPPALHGKLNEARAQLRYTRTELRRVAQLVHQRLRTALDLALADRNLEKAENAVANLRHEARQEVIRAPLGGTLRYLLAPGTVVYRGTPIATISGKAAPWIDVRVPPGATHGIKIGEAATIACGIWHGTGRVVSVGRDARPWGLVRVRIDPPKGSPLIPGEWTRVTLTHSGARTLVVPRAAVVMRGAKAMVFTIRNHHAHATAVRVLTTVGRKTWVQGTLHKSEKVAIVGVTRLVNGSPVISSGPASAH